MISVYCVQIQAKNGGHSNMKAPACAPAFTSLLAGMLVRFGMSDCGLRIWKGMEHRARGMEYEARPDQGSEVRSQRADGSKY